MQKTLKRIGGGAGDRAHEAGQPDGKKLLERQRRRPDQRNPRRSRLQYAKVIGGHRQFLFAPAWKHQDVAYRSLELEDFRS